MGNIKKWDGTQWVNTPVYRWDGTQWVNTPVYRWDGTQWVNIATQVYDSYYDAVWSQTYQNDNTQRTDTDGNTHCYQGYYSSVWGLQKSLIGFPIDTIRNDIAGATILLVEIYLTNLHSYYTSGIEAHIGYHNYNNKPTVFGYSVYDAVVVNFALGEAKWFTMPIAFGEGLKSSYAGICLYINSTSNSYYGYWAGAGESGKPRLHIRYEK